MTHNKMGYRIVRSTLGDVGVVWCYARRRATVIKIILPMPHLKHNIEKRYPSAQQKGAPNIDVLCRKLATYLAGARMRFSVADIDTSRLYPFQKTVLLCERQIPYGRVSTYGRLAVKIGNPGAARAVGMALARNPFPLIIPCHRTIQANGSLGGFQGGVKLKRRLLEIEGVPFTPSGTVVLNNVWPTHD